MLPSTAAIEPARCGREKIGGVLLIVADVRKCDEARDARGARPPPPPLNPPLPNGQMKLRECKNVCVNSHKILQSLIMVGISSKYVAIYVLHLLAIYILCSS